MAKPKRRASSRYYLASYPDAGAQEIRMKIPVARLEAADNGNKEEQNKICARYRKTLGLDIPIWWEKLQPNIRLDPNQSSVERASAKKPKVHGCTCEREPKECPGCQQGYHDGCRYDCTYGQSL